MPIAFIVGPAVALIGIVAVVFVMRHKSVEKSSMYSARRSQIEHKVRAARQRTLVPQGRQKAAPTTAEAMPPPPPTFAPTAPGATYNYEPAAYAPPPVAPLEPAPQEAPSPFAWDVGPTTAPPPPPPSLDVPPPPPEGYPAAPEPSYASSPVAEPVWTPAPAPSEPLPPAEPAQTTSPSGGGASWEIVGAPETSAPAEGTKGKKKKAKEAAQSGSWQLASGEAPGDEAEEGEVGRPNAAMAIAIAQYAVLVVGLVMVLIGVLVMVANSHGA